MSVGPSETLHATSIVIAGRAVLLCGPSGAGKSDLALRLIDRGARLVSDDYTLLRRVGRVLFASAPPTIAGKMEIRGIGIVDMPFVRESPVAMIVDLTSDIARMPEAPAKRSIAGIDVPLAALAPFEASAPIKLELLLARCGLPEDAEPDEDMA